RLAQALRISREQGLPRYESLQPLYNLYDREGYEKELEPLCRAEEVGVINYYALAAGFLSGKYRSEADLGGRARAGTVQKRYLNDRGLRILEAMDVVAADHGATVAQIALAWLLARPGITAPIVSATSVEQLQQIVAAPQIKLTPYQVRLLTQASGL
ncbi:MAG TPA: aldo/keto reductase, partial [Symbiobacteriaceae bacterium]|nr:aldo/keto reductase [Symbiobacteriaceae bacterium]